MLVFVCLLDFRLVCTSVVCSSVSYVVVPSLNGFVSKKTPVADQGTILAILASIRSLSLGFVQQGCMPVVDQFLATTCQLGWPLKSVYRCRYR